MNRKYPPHSILTFTGRIVTPFTMGLDDIDIRDIAKSLAHQGRFLGHTQEFYSVAQHCTIGAIALGTEGYPTEAKLAFLLHDASEAYLCDIPSPLKNSPVFDEYRNIEDQLQEIIYNKYGVNPRQYETVVKNMDMRMLFTEKRDLRMSNDTWEGEGDFRPLEQRIVPEPPDKAYITFLRIAERLIP